MFWYYIFSALIILVSVLLVLIVLVQNPKGGGLASGFASSNQFMGVRKTADFLEKATWTLAGSLLVLCLLATLTIPNQSQPDSKIEGNVKSATESTSMPSFPNQAPAPAQPASK
jgi:preprotein translocase subunit SecG